MFDGFESVEWTYDVDCPDIKVNIVKVSHNVLATTNYQYITGVDSPDEMVRYNTVANSISNAGGGYSMVSVDEIFAKDEPKTADDSSRKVLFHCFGRDGKLRLFYSEFPVYILNDNGKTVERV
jgi:hypothetical protein